MSQLGWKYKLKSLVDIRQEEFRQTSLMFAYNFLIIASHIIIKSLRDALFLDQLGADKLPYVYIGIALIAGVVMQGYARLSQAVRRKRLIVGINIFFILNIAAFWWLFRHYEWGWLSYALYIWAGIFSAVSVSQFWLIANDVFDPRQAKRLFGLILSGGTLGGILAGILSRSIVGSIGTENLFLITGVQLLGCSIIIKWANVQGASARSSANSSEQDTAGAFSIIWKNRHLKLLTLIIGITVLATTLVDFQFKKIIQETYNTKDALTGFFGSYYAYINIITILFQLLVTGGLLKRFGIGVAILIMPISLVLGSTATLIYPVLWAAILVKTCDDIFSLSINKLGIEILYIPILASIKTKAKAFIDVVVERTSRGIGGLLLLLFTLGISLNVRQLSIPTLVFLGIWIYLCIRIYKEYIRSIESTLQKRSLDLDTLTVDLADSSTVRQLFPLLDSGNQRQIIYALELLQNAENPELVARIQSLCNHPSPEVRALALKVLFNIGVAELVPQVEQLLGDNNEEVQVEAMRYVSVYGEIPGTERLSSFLMHQDQRIKGAAITCITRYGNEAERALLTQELIEQMLHSEGVDRKAVRLGTAKALGALGESSLQNQLFELLCDEDTDVVRQAVRSVGRTKGPDFVPSLIEMLGDPSVRVTVREALATYGPGILDTLVPSMVEEKLPVSIRRQIPKVIGMIPYQDSVDVLLEYLEHKEMDMRYKIIRALEDLRSAKGDIHFDKTLVEKYITNGIKSYYHLSVVLAAQKNGDSDSNERSQNSPVLLYRALQERLDLFEEIVFRMLRLIYPPESIYNAYRGVTSHIPRVRANAVELLDNMLNRSIKRILFPIIDDGSEALFIKQAAAFWNIQPMTTEESIMALLNGQDNWLKACTLHEVGEMQMAKFRKYVDVERESPDPLIRESAELTWRKLELGMGRTS